MGGSVRRLDAGGLRDAAMNERWRGSVEGLGLLLVTVSLLFVAFQMQQDRKIAQAELNTALLNIWASRFTAGLESDAYLGMWSKVYTTQAWETGELSDKEIAAAELDALVYWAYAEAAFEQYREGLMNESSWAETKSELLLVSEFGVFRATYDTYYREAQSDFTQEINRILASATSPIGR
jgi:hypothetical protein